MSEFDIPLYIKANDDEERPSDQLFYWMTANGLFLCRTTGVCQSDVKVESGPPQLGAHKELCRINYPKIPWVLWKQSLLFFEAIHKLYGSEAIVLLLWDREEREYRLLVPKQKVNWGACEYQTPAILPQNCILVGDIHSHGWASAGSSFTDKHDEKHRDGLHLIVGNIDSPDEQKDVSVEIAVDGHRFEAQSELVIEPMPKDVPNVKFPRRRWVKKVSRIVYKYNAAKYDSRTQQESQLNVGYHPYDTPYYRRGADGQGYESSKTKQQKPMREWDGDEYLGNDDGDKGTDDDEYVDGLLGTP